MGSRYLQGGFAPVSDELTVTEVHAVLSEGDNDGGYAVGSYREVDPTVGTMKELAALATELRHRGISLVLDFVLNHTSDEHEWAQRALDGEAEFQAYYRMFPDRTMPDAYERSMPEVFTEDHPGAFTYRTRLKKWVWTTFHTYQWDLNYENPVVFNRMVEEMLFLANQGVEVLRLDAVAFLWKRLGTNCQNCHRRAGYPGSSCAANEYAGGCGRSNYQTAQCADLLGDYGGPDEDACMTTPWAWHTQAGNECKPSNGTLCNGKEAFPVLDTDWIWIIADNHVQQR